MFNYFITYINNKKNLKDKNLRYLNFKKLTIKKIENNNIPIIIKDNFYYKNCEELKDFITIFNQSLNYRFYHHEYLYEVYNYTIGGYNVLETILKYRKGKKLELPEIAHIKKVSRVLSFTIEQMERIDEETRDWI